MILSFMVSYVRARAEGLGIECQVGIFTRAERVIILALGLLIGLNLSMVIALDNYCHTQPGDNYPEIALCLPENEIESSKTKIHFEFII